MDFVTVIGLGIFMALFVLILFVVWEGL